MWFSVAHLPERQGGRRGSADRRRASGGLGRAIRHPGLCVSRWCRPTALAVSPNGDRLSTVGGDPCSHEITAADSSLVVFDTRPFRPGNSPTAHRKGGASQGADCCSGYGDSDRCRRRRRSRMETTCRDRSIRRTCRPERQPSWPDLLRLAASNLALLENRRTVFGLRPGPPAQTPPGLVIIDLDRRVRAIG